MDCQRVTEILPWLLNGTLEAAEQQAGRVHLAQCARCQRELKETIFAASVYQQHVPAEAMVAYAFDRPILAEERDVIERHLATCQSCAAELDLALESRRLEGYEEDSEAAIVAEDSEPAANVRPFVTKPFITRRVDLWSLRVWQYGALAASIAGFIAIGGWLWNWQQARTLQTSLHTQQERLANSEAQNERLRQTEKNAGTSTPQPTDQLQQEIARLEARVKELSAPQVNIPVLEIFPQELAERTGRDRVNQLQIPRGAKTVTLILNSQSTSGSKNLSLEILDARQKAVLSQQGLARHSTGDYTINVPTELLPSGNYAFNVYDQAEGKRVRIESYRINILSSPR